MWLFAVLFRLCCKTTVKHSTFTVSHAVFVAKCCRYYVTQEWVSKKLEALVDVPEQVDLDWLRGHGARPDEQLQPEAAETPGQPGGAAAG